MTENEKAAVIGFWRCGATDREIWKVIGHTVWEITQVIEMYKQRS